jgi:hypothetical protein
MFYCDECGERQGWPEGILKSQGPCELCGKTRVCNNVASKFLYAPKEPETRSRADRLRDREID